MRDLSRMRGARRLVAGGTAVVCAWVAAGTRTPEVEVATHSAYAFDVRSTPVSGLYPGAAKRTRLTVANPYPFPIVVRSLGAGLASTSQRKCRPIPANLWIGPHLGALPLTVPARGRTPAGEFELRMPNSVADECQRTTFHLRVTASATRAGR